MPKRVLIVEDEPVLRRQLVRHFQGLGAAVDSTAEPEEGAALIADGLAGGRHRDMVDHLRIREAGGTALDHLYVVTPADARRRLGLH